MLYPRFEAIFRLSTIAMPEMRFIMVKEAKCTRQTILLVLLHSSGKRREAEILEKYVGVVGVCTLHITCAMCFKYCTFHSRD